MSFYAYYFALYAQIAIGISFMPLWLQSEGLSIQDIGTMTAAGALLAVLINPIVGGLADKTGQAKFILLGLIALALFANAGLQLASTPVAIAGIFLFSRFVSAPFIPLSESILLANLASTRLEFGKVRAWGSGAVVVTTLLCGYLVDWQGTAAVIVLVSVVLVCQAVLASALPRRTRTRDQATSLATISTAIRNRSFLLLVGSAAIAQSCHGVFYAYSTFRWIEAGHSTLAIGAFWALGVGAEVFAFALSSRVSARLTAGKIIAIGTIASVLRWGTFAYSADLYPTLFMQLLQTGSLAMTQIGVATYMRRNIPVEALSSATGTYAAGTGLISALFILVAGQLYALDSALVFLCTSIACIFASIVALLLVRTENNSATPTSP
ncbi:MFS transporter [Devosia sp. MC532]|uniref:MFS transporter n=1 Tax=Devosia sp. MC532 TaxID=2799788 RepID=UPI0018F7AB6D|nr:MFS transporter [Devosia sp. MC532]MBJ7578447.1 MFS transporter [Devosia sp. MC532]